MSNYMRNYPKEKEQNKILNNPDILYGLTHKDSFNINIENTRSRLTGDSSSLLAKNKNTIIHSNSTSHMRQDNLIPSIEKKYNIININEKNLLSYNDNNKINENPNNIIFNLLKEKNNYNNYNNYQNHSKIFSRAGNIIIGRNNNNNLGRNKKSKFINNNQYINNNNRSSSLKPNSKIKEKYNNINNKIPLNSNIKDVIKDLMETTKSPPPNLNKIDKNINDEKINIKVINDNNIESQLISDENIIGIHIKLWEGVLNMELYADNKNKINNHLKKVLDLIEKEFTGKNKSNNNIFKNEQLNKVYAKIIKIYFVLITYIKFLLVEFNFENIIMSNIKRLLLSISNNLLLMICTHASNDKNLFQKINKEFVEIYQKMIKIKKIKRSKENLSLFCTNLNKNLELSIYEIKKFSDKNFQIGFFSSIHKILLDIFSLIDTYTIEEVGNIIINGVLFYLLHNIHAEKKSSSIPNIITMGSGLSNLLAALGFMDIPAPYLPKLPENVEKDTYTLVLDLDETLVHFIITPSGGTFLIRPFCFKFLEDMSKIFEIAIFTAGTQDYADSILDVIDPNKKLIKYRLYRQHTSLCEMGFVKDLSKIGRNLNRCIIIDNLENNYKLQPNNGIQCSSWEDDMKDTQLNDLDRILSQIIEKKPQDIKSIIKKLNEEVNEKLKDKTNLNPFKDIDVNKLFK